MNSIDERINACVNGILSGSNACGTLKNAVDNNDATYFANMIRPSFSVYEEEIEALRAQRDYALRDVEIKRQALESIAANVQLTPEMKTIVEGALPGRKL